MEQELKPCPYCRGYDLERRWCHVCNGRGVVDVKAQQRERAEIVKALRKDAERWRYARTILPYEVIQDAQKDLESWNVGVSEAENKRCDEAIDAALEGATQ
ncbi:hypothetical protein [Pseudomonas aeruginosa]|uniref:hypothetical protein n=1 Tax=Pseudomonas aeruginosa TaxID=287 RepID=UPI0034D212C1